MTNQTQYLSGEKCEKLKAELDYLKKEERKKIAESLDYAKSLGDLSENAEYHEARDRQADVEDRISQIEQILKNSQIIQNHQTSEVEVGTTVITKRSGGKKEEFQIVGAEESDMLAGKISYESPLGSALLGHKKGETITVATPKGDIKYTIENIK